MSLILLLVSCLLISNNFLLGVLFLLGSLLLFDKRLGIGLGSLLHENVDSLSLALSLLLVLLLHPLDVGEQLKSLLISDLLLLHPRDSSVLNLVNDDLSSLLSGERLPLLSLFLLLEDFKSLNFHHKVQLLLLLDPLLLETLILLKLLVSNGDDL